MPRYLKYAVFPLLAAILALAACSDSREPDSAQYRTHPSCIAALATAEEAISGQMPRVLAALVYFMDTGDDATSSAQIREVDAWLTERVDQWHRDNNECASYAH